MTPKQVIAHYGDGRIQHAAGKLGVTRQTIYNWIDADAVPANWQAWIERDTNGRLRAQIDKPSEART